MRRIIKYFIDSNYRFRVNDLLGFYNRLPDEEYLKRKFKMCLGYDLNLDDPRTYNEKLQWLKLYNRKPIYTVMVDKYEVKAYVSSVIGEKYIIPTLGIWDNFDDIDFDSLPNQFVLKCTHDSGGLVICNNKSKFDLKAAKKIINSSLKRNYYYKFREWPYKNVKPRIIAEKFMEDIKTGELLDYKIMCFNGRADCSFVCSDRYSKSGLKVTFFDREWNRLPFTRHYPSTNKIINKPFNYDKMIELAEILSEGIPFVRVDFYECNNNIYFGELTFFPGSGFEEFEPEEWDYTLGSWIKLPDKKEIGEIQSF